MKLPNWIHSCTGSTGFFKQLKWTTSRNVLSKHISQILNFIHEKSLYRDSFSDRDGRGKNIFTASHKLLLEYWLHSTDYFRMNSSMSVEIQFELIHDHFICIATRVRYLTFSFRLCIQNSNSQSLSTLSFWLWVAVAWIIITVLSQKLIKQSVFNFHIGQHS